MIGIMMLKASAAGISRLRSHLLTRQPEAAWGREWCRVGLGRLRRPVELEVVEAAPENEKRVGLGRLRRTVELWLSMFSFDYLYLS